MFLYVFLIISVTMKLAVLIAMMLLLLHGVAAGEGSDEEESSGEEGSEDGYDYSENEEDSDNESQDYTYHLEEEEGGEEEGGGEVPEEEITNPIPETETSVLDIPPATIGNQQPIGRRSPYTPPVIEKVKKEVTHYPKPSVFPHKCPTPKFTIKEEVEIVKPQEPAFGVNVHNNDKYHPNRNIPPVFDNIPKMIDSPRPPRITPPAPRPPMRRPVPTPPRRVPPPPPPPRRPVVRPPTPPRPLGRPLPMAPPVTPRPQPPPVITQAPVRRIITQAPRVIPQRPRVVPQRPQVVPQFISPPPIRRTQNANMNLGQGLSRQVVRVAQTPSPLLNIRTTPQPIISGQNVGYQTSGFSGGAQGSGQGFSVMGGGLQEQTQFSGAQQGSGQFMVPQFASSFGSSGNLGLQTTQSTVPQFASSNFGGLSVGGGGQGFSTTVFNDGGLGGGLGGAGFQSGGQFLNVPSQQFGQQFSSGNDFSSFLGNNQILGQGFGTGFSNAI